MQVKCEMGSARAPAYIDAIAPTAQQQRASGTQMQRVTFHHHFDLSVLFFSFFADSFIGRHPCIQKDHIPIAIGSPQEYRWEFSDPFLSYLIKKKRIAESVTRECHLNIVSLRRGWVHICVHICGLK